MEDSTVMLVAFIALGVLNAISIVHTLLKEEDKSNLVLGVTSLIITIVGIVLILIGIYGE